MLIEIDKELFEKIKKVMQTRNKNIATELEKIKEIKNIPHNNNYLENAREVKTKKIKERIKIAMLEIKKENLKVNKYQVHKKTNIAYITLAKYFDTILKEVK